MHDPLERGRRAPGRPRRGRRIAKIIAGVLVVIIVLLIGMYFFASVQIFFIGILGEYVGAIQTQVRKLPLVVERERINFS